MLIGVMLVALAVGVTFFSNRQGSPAMVDVLVARSSVASGSVVGASREAFRPVGLPADSPLLELLVTEELFGLSAEAVFVRPVREGEPLARTAFGEQLPAGTVLTLLLARVAALDGDVNVGDHVRVLTSNPSEMHGYDVEVVAARNVSGGLGRQEQVALTVRVDTATQAAGLFRAATTDTLLLVRQTARG